MSTKTTNLEMTLLAEEDNFDTNVYNENFQKTDDKIGELNSMLGSEELTTTAQTHSGAINELNKVLNDKVAALAPVNNLTSTSTTAPLSANQGKVLNDKVAALAPVNNLTSTSTTAPLSANQGRLLNNKLGTQATFSLSGTTLTITTK